MSDKEQKSADSLSPETIDYLIELLRLRSMGLPGPWKAKEKYMMDELLLLTGKYDDASGQAITPEVVPYAMGDEELLENFEDPDAEDAFGLRHGRVHRDPGQARPAKSVRNKRPHSVLDALRSVSGGGEIRGPDLDVDGDYHLTEEQARAMDRALAKSVEYMSVLPTSEDDERIVAGLMRRVSDGAKPMPMSVNRTALMSVISRSAAAAVDVMSRARVNPDKSIALGMVNGAADVLKAVREAVESELGDE